MKIHKTSIVHNTAQIANDVEIGPFCIIDEHVIIEELTKLMPYVHVMPYRKICKNNIFHQSSVIGGTPQDLKFDNEKTSLEIGDNNTFREFCTINRGTSHSQRTTIGSNCLFINSILFSRKSTRSA